MFSGRAESKARAEGPRRRVRKPLSNSTARCISLSSSPRNFARFAPVRRKVSRGMRRAAPTEPANKLISLARCVAKPPSEPQLFRCCRHFSERHFRFERFAVSCAARSLRDRGARARATARGGGPGRPVPPTSLLRCARNVFEQKTPRLLHA